ncbi:hypothetical protein AT302_26495 [Pandoraea norimbergensis]|uniref:Uncharacterized protein n=3 Tax=Pseudomonadota TaxID=1224 RepID=A0ABN4JSF9_9BURK|nr:hypothetical protein AT302_26495 [Pandoraea norimbergensis]
MMVAFAAINCGHAFGEYKLSLIDKKEHRRLQFCVPSEFEPTVGDAFFGITVTFPSMQAAPAQGVIGNDRIHLNFLGRFPDGDGLEVALIEDQNAKPIEGTRADGVREFVISNKNGGVTRYFAFKSRDGRNVLFVDGDGHLAAFSYYSTFGAGFSIKGSVSKGIKLTFVEIDEFINKFVGRMLCK